jgi:tetratricopeptide (TPR) repeat protein
MIHLQLKNQDKAIEKFHEAISFANIETDMKNLLSAYVNLYSLYTEKGETDKAIEMLKKVLELDPENKEALLQMAKYHENKSEFDSALPYYENLLFLIPRTPIFFLTRESFLAKIKLPTKLSGTLRK